LQCARHFWERFFKAFLPTELALWVVGLFDFQVDREIMVVVKKGTHTRISPSNIVLKILFHQEQEQSFEGEYITNLKNSFLKQLHKI